ncbi:MAG: acyl-ACP--UDP-N-acetylglucosamine O-acyltransferase [Alphaproteobacteria bacterium]
MTPIHPTAIVEDGARLGTDVEVGPFCVVSGKAKLEDGVRLISHVVIEAATEIGARTVVHPHAVLGGLAQYRGDTGEGATLIIGADNVIREHVTMNIGSAKGAGVSRVGSRGYFMAYSHVAHDCQIGDGVTFANGVALGGHVIVGDEANIGGHAAIQQYSRIGRNAFVGGLTGVPNDVIPYGIAEGRRARLAGLNLIGLKRKGLSRERIHAMRAAYREIFGRTGHLFDRAQAAKSRWADFPEIQEIADFILADAKRSICTPGGTSNEDA